MRKKKQIKQFVLFLLIVILGIVSYFYPENASNKIAKKEVEEVMSLSENSHLRVTFLDVGQADSILLENNGEYMLIDAGNNEDGKKLVSYFQQLGIKNFQYVIATHAHEDHIGGMDDIINHFNIGTFYMPDAITTTKTFEDVLDALEKKQIAFETPEIDATFSFAECKFRVLHVDSQSKDLNDTSIVLKMTYGKKSVLFMGDATSKVEKEILNKDLKSDVLKVAHHGSEYSSTNDFLDQVDPDYAIISVGVGNSYHHPKEITLKKLQERNIKVYRTDEIGSIVMDSDGENLSFNSIKTDTNG